MADLEQTAVAAARTTLLVPRALQVLTGGHRKTSTVSKAGVDRREGIGPEEFEVSGHEIGRTPSHLAPRDGGATQASGTFLVQARSGLCCWGRAGR